MTYLDHNAGAPLSPRARDALVQALSLGAGNPSSVHGPGRAARAALERAREAVAAAVAGRTSGVVFTSGATESVHLALRGAPRTAGGRVLATDVEHPAVEGALATLAAAGADVDRIPVRALRELRFEERLRGAALLTLPFGHHETGDLLPLAEIAARCHAHGVLVHADAAQALGRVPLDVAALGVDLVSLSAHKCGGPAGAGALYVREGLDVAPLVPGGGQERGRRGGTEAWALHVAFGAACEDLGASVVADRAARMAAARDAIEAQVQGALPDVVVNGLGGPRLSNTTSLSIPGIDGHELVIALDLRGYAVSSGSACASGLREPSPAIRALHPDAPWRASSALRVSLGPDERAENARAFAEALATSVRYLREAPAISRPLGRP